MTTTSDLLSNPELPESLKGSVQDISNYISLLEKQRATLLDTVIEASLTGIVVHDILVRINNGEFGNV